MARVLIVATSRKTRGGITSVVKAHEKGQQWKKYHCVWIETHRDGNSLMKLIYLLIAFTKYLLYLPTADLVHIHFSESMSTKRKFPFAKLAKLLGKKLILHFHAPTPDNTYKKHPNLYKKMFMLGDLILVLSENWKKSLVSNLALDPNKIQILFNPCPEVQCDTKKAKKPIILYAGTVNQRKGYYDLISAFSLIAKHHPEWKILFAGNGEVKKGKELAMRHGIEKQVKFLGWVQGQQKDTLFNQASIFCLPSYAEGFPMAVLDAWAYALPVITTPVGGIPEIAVEGKDVLFFSPGDIKQLSQILEKLIMDSSLRKRMSDSSLKMSQTIFNIDTINEQLGFIYQQLLDKKIS